MQLYQVPLSHSGPVPNWQAVVTTENEEQTYIGLAATTFKARHSNHQTTFKYREKRGSTTLSNHMWDLIDKGVKYDLEWRFVGRAQPFSTISEICNLCTLEKYHILFTPQMATLNKREEINNWCPHKKDVLLDKTWKPLGRSELDNLLFNL